MNCAIQNIHIICTMYTTSKPPHPLVQRTAKCEKNAERGGRTCHFSPNHYEFGGGINWLSAPIIPIIVFTVGAVIICTVAMLINTKYILKGMIRSKEEGVKAGTILVHNYGPTCFFCKDNIYEKQGIWIIVQVSAYPSPRWFCTALSTVYLFEIPHPPPRANDELLFMSPQKPFLGKLFLSCTLFTPQFYFSLLRWHYKFESFN